MAWTRGGSTRTGTAEHKRWAKAVKDRDGWQCRRCGYQGTPGNADVQADHITNVATGGDPLGSGITLCSRCHAEKTQREAAQGRRLKSRKRPTERHPGLL